MSRLERGGTRPTAYFVLGSPQVLSVISWLMGKNRRLGIDYTLISRDDDELLAPLLPRCRATAGTKPVSRDGWPG